MPRREEKAINPRLPLVLCWDHPANPLPVRAIRAPRRLRTTGFDSPPWLRTGPMEKPFDFCRHAAALCADLVARCAELAHIDVSRLLFAVTQARSGRRRGLQARVTPLRFRDGALTRQRGGVTYQVQRYCVDRREMLYLVTFCLPRFLDQTFEDKFVTLFHELYHIAPAFDGDLRRHDGHFSVHSRSQQQYDRHMAVLAREYLASRPDPALHDFLRLDFAQLEHRHGQVVGVVVPRPKMIPLRKGSSNERGAASNRYLCPPPRKEGRGDTPL